MKPFFAIAFIFSCSFSFAQYTYQNANGIVVNPNYKINEASVETSFEFNHFQLTGIYNISKKVFLHSNLKLNVLQQNAEKFFSGLLGGDAIILRNNDIGYDGGFGLQNIGRIGKFHMQLELGYDYEKQRYTFDENLMDANQNFVDSISVQNNNLYKISSNLNFTKVTDRYNLNYLLRLSYCKFTKYEYNYEDAMLRNRSFGIVEPAVEMDFKLLKNRKLFIVTQFGLSLPLSSFKYSYRTDLYSGEATTDTDEYLFDMIVKLGVKYNF